MRCFLQISRIWELSTYRYLLCILEVYIREHIPAGVQKVLPFTSWPSYAPLEFLLWMCYVFMGTLNSWLSADSMCGGRMNCVVRGVQFILAPSRALQNQ